MRGAKPVCSEGPCVICRLDMRERCCRCSRRRQRSHMGSGPREHTTIRCSHRLWYAPRRTPAHADRLFELLLLDGSLTRLACAGCTEQQLASQRQPWRSLVTNCLHFFGFKSTRAAVCRRDVYSRGYTGFGSDTGTSLWPSNLCIHRAWSQLRCRRLVSRAARRMGRAAGSCRQAAPQVLCARCDRAALFATTVTSRAIPKHSCAAGFLYIRSEHPSRSTLLQLAVATMEVGTVRQGLLQTRCRLSMNACTVFSSSIASALTLS